MGNSPSTEAGPRGAARKVPHKLSKPRTARDQRPSLASPNTTRFSSAGLSELSVAISAQVSPLSASTATLPLSGQPTLSNAGSSSNGTAGESSGPEARSAKPSRRRSLLRTLSLRNAEPMPKHEHDPHETTRLASLRDEGGPEGLDQLAGHTRTLRNQPSWTADGRLTDGRRLQDLEEVPNRYGSMGQRAPTMPPISPSYTNTSFAEGSATLAMSRSQSDVELYAPVRRRSIIVAPGVATRPTRQPPPLTLAQKRSNRHSMPATPNESRNNSIDSQNSWAMFIPPPRNPLTDSSMPRVATPLGADQMQAGAFKFGSLRIINGAASPISPEVERSRRHTLAASPTLNRGNHGAGEGGDGSGGDYFLHPFKARTQGHATRAALTDMTFVQPPIYGASAGEANKPVHRLAPVKTTLPQAQQPQRNEGQEARASQDAPPPPAKDTEYLPQMHASPTMVEEPPTKPELKITSKHMATEDSLFDDETADNTEFRSAREVLEVRRDADAKPRRPAASAEPRAETVGRSDSGYAGSPATYTSSTGRSVQRKPLAKADSGYSSNVSLRSLHGSVDSRPPVPEKDAPLDEENPQTRLIRERQAEAEAAEKEIAAAAISKELRIDMPKSSPEAIANPHRTLPGTPAPPPVPEKDDMLLSQPLSPVPTEHSSSSGSRSSQSLSLQQSHSATQSLAPKGRGSPPQSSLHSSRASGASGSGQRPRATTGASNDSGSSVARKSLELPRRKAPSHSRSSSDASVALSITSPTHPPGKQQSKIRQLLSTAGISKATGLQPKQQQSAPLVAYQTHEFDKDVPPVPVEAEDKLRVHMAQFPQANHGIGGNGGSGSSHGRTPLRRERSGETLRTIFSVGSLEVAPPDHGKPMPLLPWEKPEPAPQVVGSVPPSIPETRRSDSNDGEKETPIVRKPIARKPVPIRVDSGSKASATSSSVQSPASEKPPQRKSTNPLVGILSPREFGRRVDRRGIRSSPTTPTLSTSPANPLARSSDTALPLSSNPPDSNGGRSMSMTAATADPREEVRPSARQLRRVSSSITNASSWVADLPDPAPFKRPPPPVSMRNGRRGMNLRIPPPMRPRSTPPGAIGRQGGRPMMSPVSGSYVNPPFPRGHPAPTAPQEPYMPDLHYVPTFDDGYGRGPSEASRPPQQQQQQAPNNLSLPPSLRRIPSTSSSASSSTGGKFQPRTDHHIPRWNGHDLSIFDSAASSTRRSDSMSSATSVSGASSQQPAGPEKSGPSIPRSSSAGPPGGFGAAPNRHRITYDGALQMPPRRNSSWTSFSQHHGSPMPFAHGRPPMPGVAPRNSLHLGNSGGGPYPAMPGRPLPHEQQSHPGVRYGGPGPGPRGGGPPGGFLPPRQRRSSGPAEAPVFNRTPGGGGAAGLQGGEMDIRRALDQFDYGGGGRYPTHMEPAQGPEKGRAMSMGPGPRPPYRVLHSYNSPAYKNVPIWG